MLDIDFPIKQERGHWHGLAENNMWPIFGGAKIFIYFSTRKADWNKCKIPKYTYDIDKWKKFDNFSQSTCRVSFVKAF